MRSYALFVAIAAVLVVYSSAARKAFEVPPLEEGVDPCRRMDPVPRASCLYVCPENSCVNPDVKCVNNFWECNCNPGFLMNNTSGACVVVTAVDAPLEVAPLVDAPLVDTPAEVAPVEAGNVLP